MRLLFAEDDRYLSAMLAKGLREHAYAPLPIGAVTPAPVEFDGELYRAEIVFAHVEEVHRVHQWWAVDRANHVAYHFYEPVIGTPKSMSVLVRAHDMTDGVLEVDVVAMLDLKPCMHARDLVPCAFEQGILW